MKLIRLYVIILVCLFNLNKAQSEISNSRDTIPINFRGGDIVSFFISVPISYINHYTDSLLSLNIKEYLSLQILGGIYAEDILNKIKHKDMVVHITLLGSMGFPIDNILHKLNQFENLNSIFFEQCKLDTFDFQSSKENFSLRFRRCPIQQLPKGLEHFKPFLKLDIEVDTLANFDLEGSLRRFVNRNNITELMIKYKQLKEFPESIFELTNLQKLFFYNSEIKVYPKRFNNLKNLLYARLCSDDIEVYRNLNEINNITFFGNDFFRNKYIGSLSLYRHESDIWHNDYDKIFPSWTWMFDGPPTLNGRLLKPEDYYLSVLDRENFSKNFFSFEKHIIILQIKSLSELELKITDLELTDEVQIEIFQWNKDKKKVERKEIHELNNPIILQSELKYSDIIEIRVNNKSKYIRVI